jgi:hypothetical protein
MEPLAKSAVGNKGESPVGLQNEIDSRSSEIKTDSYPMSIGEISNLYRDGEIDVHPEFQRIFRWTETQKTRLIESILLGIPLPPIFVAQRKDGVWDVVDGVQRMSTILQFMGLLKDEKGQLVTPLALLGTKYLPSLKNKLWQDKKDPRNSFTKAQQLYIKRAKLDLNIVLKESDEQSKYELFMRLNTGGSPLSPQEVRNCLLVMAHPEVYEWLRNLADNDNFLSCVGLSDRAIDEQYHMELALRFILFRTLPVDRLKEVGDIGEFLNDNMELIAKNGKSYLNEEEEAFKATFEALDLSLQADSFRRYDAEKDKFVGGFSISAYEAVALGLGFHFSQSRSRLVAEIPGKVRSLWATTDFVENSGSGIRASSRIPKIVPLGRKLFKR